jgi:predicted LPLAT superfamily acyltransferase
VVSSMQDDLKRVIEKYTSYPNFFDLEIVGVNQVGHFGDTLLHLAASNGNIDDMRILIRAGSDVNRAGEKGETPLHLAARFGEVEVVRLAEQFAWLAVFAPWSLKSLARVVTCRQVAKLLKPVTSSR